ncbi:MAG: hypothetical protein E5Y81_09025 [Mesorhizobium sp.]|nr:MAG: hypothetical protein E5Y81_09025 [Mesorhizobium sp.]
MSKKERVALVTVIIEAALAGLWWYLASYGMAIVLSENRFRFSARCVSPCRQNATRSVASCATSARPAGHRHCG